MRAMCSWRYAPIPFMLAASCSSGTPPPGHGHGGHQHPGHDHHEGNHQPGFHHRFEKAEEWAKIFDDPSRDEWQRPDDVVRLLALSPGMTVADIGAGTGYFLGRLSRAVGAEGRVLGLDVEPDMVVHMKSRAEREQLANVEPRLVEPADPKLERGTIDRVLIVDTWHHIDHRSKYAATLKDSLKSGGAIYVVDYTLEAPRGPPKEHRLSAEKVIAELAEAGLVAEVLNEELPDQYVVRAVAR
jgi:predicted methyltransferase